MPFAVGTWTSTGIPLEPTGPGNNYLPVGADYDSVTDIFLVPAEQAAFSQSFNPGGIFRSTDRGVTWTMTYNGALESDFVGGVTVYAPVVVRRFINPNTSAAIWVALIRRITYRFGTVPVSCRLTVYRSSDGITWTPGAVLVDLLDLGEGSPAGIFVFLSISSFATRVVGSTVEHYMMIKAERTGTPTQLVRGLFKSSDLGVSWAIFSDPGDFTGSLYTMPNQVLVQTNLAAASGFARSEDGGTTWIAASPQFAGATVEAFGGGPIVCCSPAGLITKCQTRISCDDGVSFPGGNLGPEYGATGSLVGGPALLKMGGWEILMVASGGAGGNFDLVYSSNGGESDTVVSVPTGIATLSRTVGFVKLVDGRPVVVTSQGRVVTSSDTAAGIFGTRIYCLTAPAPGVGAMELSAICGDFYNPCPQLCPTDPLQPVGVIVAAPVFEASGAEPYSERIYGTRSAIYGGTLTSSGLPVLGVPAGVCGNTFINEPCAVAQCP